MNLQNVVLGIHMRAIDPGIVGLESDDVDLTWKIAPKWLKTLCKYMFDSHDGSGNSFVYNCNFTI